jgi:NAD(P)-dependent dehydrogenase (short-subunit alcohol dehydrogenase family)
MFTIDLGGKTALITGGSQGLGLVTAQTLHQAGANVAIGFFPDDAGQNRARAERAVAALGAIGRPQSPLAGHCAHAVATVNDGARDERGRGHGGAHGGYTLGD